MRSQRREGRFFLNSFALNNRINEICWNVAQHFNFTARPFDFYFIHLGFGAQAEM